METSRNLVNGQVRLYHDLVIVYPWKVVTVYGQATECHSAFVSRELHIA